MISLGKLSLLLGCGLSRAFNIDFSGFSGVGMPVGEISFRIAPGGPRRVAGRRG